MTKCPASAPSCGAEEASVRGFARAFALLPRQPSVYQRLFGLLGRFRCSFRAVGFRAGGLPATAAAAGPAAGLLLRLGSFGVRRRCTLLHGGLGLVAAERRVR